MQARPEAGALGIEARVRVAAPAPSGLDTTADVRAMRKADAALSDAAAARRSSAEGSEADSEAMGAALIAIDRVNDPDLAVDR